MNYFVFRNNTVERFFPKGYTFSGYGDISSVPADADGYVWFYQAPISYEPHVAVNAIQGHLQKFGFILSHISDAKPVIALTMDNFYPMTYREDDSRVQRAIAEYNTGLYDAARIHPNLKVIDFAGFTRQYPTCDLLDWKFYFISQMGLNPKLTKDFRAWWDRKLESIALKRKKCLVLDLDNTVWGGVLGEEGISGIRIGGDYPGRAFLFFQKSLVKLSKEGVILAVCSKNNEQDVLDAWEKNPFMVLKKEHFAATRINWNDKVTNLRELADELNIGLDSMVFVDDSPAERELIRQMLPMVSVPDFPAQPYGLPVFFRQLVEDYFKMYTITAEDKKKTEQYRANAARVRARSSFGDYNDFLESLDIRITVAGANAFNIPRIAQLTQKTNQFNLTTKRYTDADIRDFLSKGWKIWCMAVSDRFGDNGITGTVLVDGDRIDTFLMSCRILGRGIEEAFLKQVLALLKAQGLRRVRARFVPTAKNALVKDFYDKCGFSWVSENSGEKEYIIDLDGADLQIAKYYTMILK